jgi:hypothetical protein
MVGTSDWQTRTGAMLTVMIAGLAVAACERPGAEAAEGRGADPAAGESGAGPGTGGACRVVERTVTLPEGLSEPSGAAWSGTLPGAFWSHNDSGGDPELFLVTAAGAPLGRVRLPGVEMVDWEDMAAGPCADGKCLFVADIGDNGRKGEPIRLYQLPEPGRGERLTAGPRTYRGAFPDGKGRDAEAIFVLPDGGIYLITKGNDEPVELYRWPTPLVEGRPAVLELVHQLAPKPEQTGDRVTGASASPDGRHVAVRTYGMLAIYRTEVLLAGGDPGLRMDLTPIAEGQGEGVALADDGSVLLVSESGSRHVPGTAAVLRCTLP